jgi:16S rRNA (adenine1518-N6/adenine1519-N6)-dimethyltransferase
MGFWQLVHMSLLERTKVLLRNYRSLPKKTYGQNFMVEPWVFDSMIDHASLTKGDTVLDIGAGLGFLTRLMAEKSKNVIAVEADQQLASILCEQLSHIPNVKIVVGDVLKATVSEFNKIVSTPPYNISSRLLLWILYRHFDCAVLVLQKEFANRLAASVGNEEYGWLSVLTYYRAEVELLDEVPKSVFYPPPKVDSVITRLVPRIAPFDIQMNGAGFKRFVQMLFTQRNKKIRNAVLSYLRSVRGVSKEDANVIAEKLPFLDKRVQELAPEDFGVLANALQ